MKEKNDIRIKRKGKKTKSDRSNQSTLGVGAMAERDKHSTQTKKVGWGLILGGRRRWKSSRVGPACL